MPDPNASMPWMTAWIELQQKLLEQAAHAPGGNDEAMRRLTEFGGDYVGIAGDWWRLFGNPVARPAGATPAAGLESMQAQFIDRYRQLFTPEIARTAAAPDPLYGNATAIARWHAATRRVGLQVVAIANDAFRRLSAELMRNDAATPITSLRELHGLWIECGEAAYAAAAHGDEFADAQAELLAAWVELRGEQRRARA